MEYSYYELLEEICFAINRSFPLSVTLYSCIQRQGRVSDSRVLEKLGSITNFIIIVVIYYTMIQGETKLVLLVFKQMMFFVRQILLETHSAPFCCALCSCQRLSDNCFEDTTC